MNFVDSNIISQSECDMLINLTINIVNNLKCILTIKQNKCNQNNFIPEYQNFEKDSTKPTLQN